MHTLEVIENLRNMLANEKVKGEDEAKQMAVMLAGLSLLENVLIDLKRGADALEQIALNTQPRP